MSNGSDGANEFLLWEENQQERSVDVVKQINSKNAKYVACGLVIGFILYHGIVHIRYGRLWEFLPKYTLNCIF